MSGSGVSGNRMEVAMDEEGEAARAIPESRFEKRLTALTDLMQQALVRRASADEELSEITAVAARGMEVARVGVWHLAEDGSGIRCTCLFDAASGTHESGAYLPEEAAPAYFRALQENKLLAAPDARNDPRTREFRDAYLEPLGILSMLDAPIFFGGRLVGVVCFESVGEPREWSADEQLFALAVANLAALLESQRARAAAEEQLRQSQKMESVGRLAGGIAHDFNNVLTTILGVTELLLLEREAGDPLRRDLEEILDSAGRAAGLTRQLLAFSRQQVMHPRTVCLNEVVLDMHRMFERLLGGRIELEMHLASRLPHVVVDPGQIERVLMNLVVNARDAMPQGGTLSFATRVEGGEVVLAVKDTGVGMDRRTRERAFEPFFTTKGPGGGTGLGLSTVYGIVRQSGGTVAIESEPGEGTTFTIRLPVDEGDREGG
jgi:two-component system, cell cycle sensor histidine kinase and response regulator CckA